MRYLLFLAALGALGWPAPGKAGWFGPSDYDECILESMKGVTSDDAAKFIAQSCRRKFPPSDRQNIPSRELSEEEIKNLTITWDRNPLGLAVTVHNGNKGVTVSQMSIRIRTTIRGKSVENMYVDDGKAEPESTGLFVFKILQPDANVRSTLGIVGARGY